MIQLSSPDVFLSHDWPTGVEQHGNLNDLLRRKPFLRGDIQSKQLGSPPLMSLLRNLKPSWWFAAHLHTRFEARVQHDFPDLPAVPASNPDEIAIGDEDDDFDVPTSTTAPQNPDEILLENEIETAAPPPVAPRETKFLALDKCLPRRQFLEARLFFFCRFSVILRLISRSSTFPQRKKGRQARTPRQSCFLTTQNGSPSRARSNRTSRASANRLPTQSQTRRVQQSSESGTGCTRMRCRSLVPNAASTRASGSCKGLMARASKRTRLWRCSRWRTSCDDSGRC